MTPLSQMVPRNDKGLTLRRGQASAALVHDAAESGRIPLILSRGGTGGQHIKGSERNGRIEEATSGAPPLEGIGSGALQTLVLGRCLLVMRQEVDDLGEDPGVVLCRFRARTILIHINAVQQSVNRLCGALLPLCDAGPELLQAFSRRQLRRWWQRRGNDAAESLLDRGSGRGASRRRRRRRRGEGGRRWATDSSDIAERSSGRVKTGEAASRRDVRRHRSSGERVCLSRIGASTRQWGDTRRSVSRRSEEHT